LSRQTAAEAALERASHPDAECDVAIVGGGVVGATLAAALANAGFEVAIIEARSLAQALAGAQAYALSYLSSCILQNIGIWERLHPQIAAFRCIHLSDAHRANSVRFRPQDLGRPAEALGYVAEHRPLLGELQAALKASPRVQWWAPARATAISRGQGSVGLELACERDRYRLRARLLVGADGARSRIRQQAGIGTWGWAYWQSCVAAIVQPERPPHGTAFESFWPSGPMGMLPLPGNRYQVIWTAPHPQARALHAASARAFAAALEQRAGRTLGRVSLAGERGLFPLQLMQSERYAGDRVALVGDAAHRCHPVGGQGLNLGIRDAAALAQVLQGARQAGDDIGDRSVLARYERWRQRENRTILGATDLLDRLFSNEWLPAVAARQLGLQALHQLAPVRARALQLMAGLNGELPQLARSPHS
jgi:2-octaprenyl-6-methoxyphenol hydroxylase